MTASMVDYKIYWLKMMSVSESRAVVGRHDRINGRDSRNRRNRKEYERHKALACSSAKEVVLESGLSLGALSDAAAFGVAQGWKYQSTKLGRAEFLVMQPHQELNAHRQVLDGGVGPAGFIWWRQRVALRLSVRHGYWAPLGALHHLQGHNQGQSWSAVEIHPLPARRPGMRRRLEHRHNALNKRGFSCLFQSRRES